MRFDPAELEHQALLLRAIRRGAGLSQREAARAARIPLSTFAGWESTGFPAPYLAVERLAVATGALLVAVDEHGRTLGGDESEEQRDASGRRIPAHLQPREVGAWGRGWWYLERIADISVRPPQYTYTPRRTERP